MVILVIRLLQRLLNFSHDFQPVYFIDEALQKTLHSYDTPSLAIVSLGLFNPQFNPAIVYIYELRFVYITAVVAKLTI